MTRRDCCADFTRQGAGRHGVLFGEKSTKTARNNLIRLHARVAMHRQSCPAKRVKFTNRWWHPHPRPDRYNRENVAGSRFFRLKEPRYNVKNGFQNAANTFAIASPSRPYFARVGINCFYCAAELTNCRTELVFPWIKIFRSGTRLSELGWASPHGRMMPTKTQRPEFGQSWRNLLTEWESIKN